MDKDKLINAIDNQLEDIQEQFEMIRNHDGKIPSIEIDLIMANIRNIYDSFIHLDRLNRPVISFEVEKQAPVSVKAEKKVVEEVKAPVEPMEEERIAEPVAMDEEPEPVEVKEKQVAETVPEPAPMVEAKEEEPAPEPVAPPVPVSRPVREPGSHRDREEPALAKTTLDLFGEAADTLADRLKDPGETRIADKLKTNKIIDLKSAIGINEKFLFINELFEGSLKNYEESIIKLNACQSLDQAEQVLSGLQTTFGWDAENHTARSFIDLVNRKF